MITDHDIRWASLDLSSSKKELLEKRLRGAFKTSARAQLIPSRSDSSPAPLSFSQERLWIIDQIQPGSDAYHLPVLLRLTGRVDAVLLEKSLNEIIRRHEVLRATFPAVDGTPAQVIAAFEERRLPIADLRERPDNERNAQAWKIVSEDAQQPFDLAAGPLVRWHLLRLADQE